MSLGYGHAGVPDKLERLYQQIFLIAGPTRRLMYRYRWSVRGIPTDGGRERMLADCPDITDAYFRGCVDEPPLLAAAGTFAFPNAWAVPGPQHICDWLIMQVLTK